MQKSSLDHLFASNREWASRMVATEPDYFSKLVNQQSPEYLWIGCADSRVPANEIVGLRPGQIFVHRNVANLVVHSDLNCLSTIQYGVERLKVKHVMVVGHFGCGGVQAVVDRCTAGLSDNWLRHIEDIANRYSDALLAISDECARARCLCELNVLEQMMNVVRTTILRRAWFRGQRIHVHGLIYDLSDGILSSVAMVKNQNEMQTEYQRAQSAIVHGYQENLGVGALLLK